MAEHQWVPYAGILAREPYAGQLRQAGLGPHTRECPVCGLISSDDDDCADLECTPGRHRQTPGALMLAEFGVVTKEESDG